MPLTLLLLPSLVAYGGAELQPGPAGQGAAPGTHHHAQAGLLEDLAVVVVGVAHGPAAEVPLRVLLLARVDEPHVAIGPLLEGVEVLGLLQQGRWGGRARQRREEQENVTSMLQPDTLPCCKTHYRGKKAFSITSQAAEKDILK